MPHAVIAQPHRAAPLMPLQRKLGVSGFNRSPSGCRSGFRSKVGVDLLALVGQGVAGHHI